MNDELRFDYNDYWEPEKSEPKYVEESYDIPTDQDFWELHRFVLECELDTYDDIYTESVGSTLKAAAGTVADKIAEIFLRICEAFKKKAMKKAILWLRKNSNIIGRVSKLDRYVRGGLETAMHGCRVISIFMARFKKLAETSTPDTAVEKLNEELEELTNAVKSEIKKSTPVERATAISAIINNLESGEYDKWYRIAQEFRVKLKKINRAAQRGGAVSEITGPWLQLPKIVLGAFDEITKGIKTVRDNLPAKLDEQTIAALEKNVDDLDKTVQTLRELNEKMKEDDENFRKVKADLDARQKKLNEKMRRLMDENDRSIKEINGEVTGESYYDLFESEYIGESSDVTDQDFWELHSFVLECELDTYGDIYSESFGSMVKASFGTILDKLVNAFLRICEAFKKKSMKRAINWFKENAKLINEKGKDDKEIYDALVRIKHGHRVIFAVASLFEEWSKIDEGKLTNEKVARRLIEISKEVDNRLEKKVATPLPRLVDAVVSGLESDSGGYDDWYKFAQNLRTKTKLLYRIAQADGNTDVTDLAQKCLELPKKILDAFNDITAGIKTIHSRVSAKSKAEAKAKKETPKPATESYYVSFEPEVDILF